MRYLVNIFNCFARPKEEVVGFVDNLFDDIQGLAHFKRLLFMISVFNGSNRAVLFGLVDEVEGCCKLSWRILALHSANLQTVPMELLSDACISSHECTNLTIECDDIRTYKTFPMHYNQSTKGSASSMMDFTGAS